MKKIIIILSICFSYSECFGEEIPMSVFEYILHWVKSINGVQNVMHEFDYEFSHAEKEKDDTSGRIYTRSYFKKKAIPNKSEKNRDEIIWWQQNDSPFLFTTMVFVTKNKALYSKYKTEIEKIKTLKVLVDKSENNCIEIAYNNEIRMYTFKTV